MPYCPKCGAEAHVFEPVPKKKKGSVMLAFAGLIFSTVVGMIGLIINSSGIFDGEIVTVLGKTFYYVNTNTIQYVEGLTLALIILGIVGFIGSIIAMVTSSGD
jgi:hypothetical protein